MLSGAPSARRHLAHMQVFVSAERYYYPSWKFPQQHHPVRCRRRGGTIRISERKQTESSATCVYS